MDVTVVVPTTGPRWTELAHEMAIPSALAAGANEVIEVLAPNLRDARNEGLARVRTPWTVFLDADDCMPAVYLDAMARALHAQLDRADVLVPQVAYLFHHGDNRQVSARSRFPRVSGHDHDCVAGCLTAGNWVVIGAAVRTELAVSVGGFREFDWSEDWDFWLRLHLAGAAFVRAPEAVYHAYVHPHSRNRSGRKDHLRSHNAILRANGLDPI